MLQFGKKSMGSSILVCVRFLDLFGLVCSGFCLQRVNTGCSGCSVDFVEKMWESLWGKRWENEEKLCGKEWIGRFLDCFCGIFKFFTSRVEKFCGWIYTCNYLCKGGGFAHFPHRLLL